MKTAFIVNFWADTDEKVNTVVKCINSIKPIGFPVIYTSLYPIDSRIKEVADDTFYRDDNQTITFQELIDNPYAQVGHNYRFSCSSFEFRGRMINSKDHTFSIINQLLKNLRLLKEQGYTHFYLIVGDCIINEKDIEAIKSLDLILQLTNKKGYFEDLTNVGFDGYQTLFFGAEINFFLDAFPDYKDKNDFIKTCVEVHKDPYFAMCLEVLFIRVLQPLKDKLIIADRIKRSNPYEGGYDGWGDEKIEFVTLLNNSKDTLDILTARSPIRYHMFWNDELKSFDMFMENMYAEDSVIKIYNNDVLVTEYFLQKNTWILINTFNQFGIYSVYREGELDLTIDINESNFEKLNYCNHYLWKK